MTIYFTYLIYLKKIEIGVLCSPKLYLLYVMKKCNLDSKIVKYYYILKLLLNFKI